MIFLFIFILFFIGCSDNKVVPQKDYETVISEEQADITSWNINLKLYDSTFVRAIIKAKKARVFSERQETILDSNVYVEFFSKNSFKKAGELYCDWAKIDDNTKNMIAKGNVIVISDSSKTKLQTSILHWNNQTQKFYSSEYVQIKSPYEYIEGYGFESDINLTKYKIYKVRGVKQ